jgi:glycogen(starch) synthase
MRILFWSETFWPRVGGVESLAAKLLPALRERGHEFVVVTWENIKHPDQIGFNGMPIYRFPFFAASGQCALNQVWEHRSRVAEVKRVFRPELVHVNSYGRSVFFHLATGNAWPVPSLLTLHQPLSGEPAARDSLLQKTLQNSDWVTACSASILQHARGLVPEIIPVSSFIHNAIEKPPFDPQPLPADPPRLLCLGRLVPEKGFDLALQAFAAVLKEVPDAVLRIAGDGPEREKLWNQGSELGLPKSVEFLGSVPPDEALHLIDQSTIVVVPSRIEGFGLVALEAAVMARPVVAARVGGLPEIVIHEETGLLVDEGDDAALAEAIVFLLNNPQTAGRMGQAARGRAEIEFSWQRYVDSYDNLYRLIVQGDTAIPAKSS